jgi:hypothetical protein
MAIREEEREIQKFPLLHPNAVEPYLTICHNEGKIKEQHGVLWE